MEEGIQFIKKKTNKQIRGTKKKKFEYLLVSAHCFTQFSSDPSGQSLIPSHICVGLMHTAESGHRIDGKLQDGLVGEEGSLFTSVVS